MREGEGTKFTIDRKIFSSDIWFSSPWKLKIWLYLVGKANHTDGSFMGIEIKRGQLIRSLRTIQKECAYMIGYRVKKPSLSTVRRICEELTKDARIEQRTVHCGTLFTICNYNDLQPMEKVRKEQRTNELRNNGETVGEQNKNVNNKKNKEKTFLSDSEEVRLSELLSSLILKNNPKAKKPDIQPWAKNIDLMIRIDKRTPADIENIIRWCQSDSFWHTNILSTAKLRKQFDQLFLKMSNEKSKTPKIGKAGDMEIYAN